MLLGVAAARGFHGFVLLQSYHFKADRHTSSCFRNSHSGRMKRFAMQASIVNIGWRFRAELVLLLQLGTLKPLHGN